jgi:Cu(I)/Ag(I) efflux system protein CusF
MKGSTDMKNFAHIVVLALSVVAAQVSHAQTGGMGGMDMKDMDMSKDKKGSDKKAGSKVHKGVGTVKKVDAAASTVTIAHGPIKSMNWPAMNMTFAVNDKALLDKFSQDKKVEFEFVQQGSDYVIKSVK